MLSLKRDSGKAEDKKPPQERRMDGLVNKREVEITLALTEEDTAVPAPLRRQNQLNRPEKERETVAIGIHCATERRRRRGPLSQPKETSPPTPQVEATIQMRGGPVYSEETTTVREPPYLSHHSEGDNWTVKD
ncbi:hypothetical protein CRG98_043596 [Punica granatum]|uniref:Uncharacterized protein n=1 Tax=Punica granatum TaxID=22663 RepID=A0A2I0HWF1_PUNGR|nr:hypothetical protein CRG98_043596 [Punica granatum]